MHILICPDKFKGSLSAPDVCEAVGAGVLRALPDASISCVPLADGGEGTCDLLTAWHHGSTVKVTVAGPLFSPVEAHYGMSQDKTTAFIEMASASGLALLHADERNPLLTTTLGTGELIADAMRRNVSHIVLGIGGSATNDAGIGMATALGYQFFDADAKVLEPTGKNLIRIHRIETAIVHPRLKEVQFVTLCDVTNPLFGPQGAAHVYGPQKGADKDAIALLDLGLQNFSTVVHRHLGESVDFPGAGAAGGLGAGCKVFLQSTIEKGIRYIIDHTELNRRIAEADLVITGEGKIDSQTFSGKVVSEVARLAAEAGKPIMTVCGKCEVEAEEIQSHQLGRVISLVDDTTTAETAMRDATRLLSDKVFDAIVKIPGFM